MLIYTLPKISSKKLPKIGFSYNVFDGDELLKYSINSIKPYAEYISVIYSTKSNFGNQETWGLKDNLLKLQSKGYIDELIEYIPKVSGNSCDGLNNEIEKRNIGLQKSIDNKCDVHVSIDCDEMYNQKEIEYAIWRFMLSGAESMVLQHKQFYKNTKTEVVPSENTYVTLFELLNKNIENYQLNAKGPVLDPTRKLGGRRRYIYFQRFEIEMMHLSFIRKNLKVKLVNSSANIPLESQDKICDYYENYKANTDALWADLSYRKTKSVNIPNLPYIEF